MDALWSDAQDMSALTGILWACKILNLFNNKRERVAMVSWGVFILLWPHKDSMIFLIFILITEFNFLKLQGPLTFFDYAVFCEIEILIETRAVSLFPEKKSNNLWSPSYMQDLIKSLVEVTRTASAETQLFFIHGKHELSLRSKTEMSIIHGGFVCLPMQKSKTQAGFYGFRSDPTTHHGSAVRYWALLNSYWLSILLCLLPADVWDSEKVFDCFADANMFLKQVFIEQNEKCFISYYGTPGEAVCSLIWSLSRTFYNI